MTDMPELSDPVHLGTVEVVDYLVGHAPDNEGQNPFGQDHVQDRLEEMDPEALRAVAMEAIWRLANTPTSILDAIAVEQERAPAVETASAIPKAERTLGESDGQFLARIGTDAEAWATEFLVRFGEAYNIREAMPGTGFGERVPTVPGSDAHHMVTGWFANAIGAGESNAATTAYAATSIVRMLVAEDWVHLVKGAAGPMLVAGAGRLPVDLDPLQGDLLAELAERKPS